VKARVFDKKKHSRGSILEVKRGDEEQRNRE